MSTPLTQALDLLGLDDTECVSGLSQAPGGTARGFRVPVAKLRARGPYAADRNYWLGLCPINGGGTGRGTAADVVRVPAVWADLDVKPGGLPSFDAAEAVTADLAAMLGTEPVYVTMTGHGLQPVWAVDEDDSHQVDRAAHLLRRWGLLVRIVARAHGGDADSVFDVARVLRAPGSTNLKADPVPTSWEPRNGHPITLDELADSLDAYNVPDVPDGQDVEDHPAGAWAWADTTCAYVRGMVTGWGTDTPDARHPWAVSAAVRLTAAHRLGCITEADHEAAAGALQARLDVLRAADGARPGEVAEAVAFAVPLVETMTDTRCAAELRDHTHDPGPTVLDPTPAERDLLPNLDDLDPALRDEVLLLLRRNEARRIVAEVEAAQNPAPPVDAALLADILNRDPEPPARVDGLLPADGRLLLAAARKTGKTTWLLNLARALLTGEPFLGTLPVRPILGRVAFLNYEVSGAQLARWAHEAAVPGDRLLLVNLRGRRNLLATETGRTELVDLLTAAHVDVLLVDPFGRAYTGKSQNDAGEVAPWLVRLDEVTTQAGCTELVLAAHAGWNGERSRGSSALEDWPDSIVWLTRDAETEQRYMRAEGRDVLLDEDRLDFDATRRQLTLSGAGGRAEAAQAAHLDALVDALVDVVNREPGVGVRGIARRWRAEGFTFANGDEQRASREAVERGLVTLRTGRNNTKCHHPTQVPPSVPRRHPGGTRVTSASSASQVPPRGDSSASYTDGGTTGPTRGTQPTEALA